MQWPSNFSAQNRTTWRACENPDGQNPTPRVSYSAGLVRGPSYLDFWVGCGCLPQPSEQVLECSCTWVLISPKDTAGYASVAADVQVSVSAHFHWELNHYLSACSAYTSPLSRRKSHSCWGRSAVLFLPPILVCEPEGPLTQVPPGHGVKI